MNNLKVSIIITTYKRMYNDILRSIKSAAIQDYSNKEIILVDDNNTDSDYRNDIINNIDNIKKMINGEFIYIKHDNNMGAQVSRNDGIKASKGDLLAFLDDDDEWDIKKISKQVSLYSIDVGLIYCKGYLYDEGTNEKREYATTPYFKDEFKFKELLYSDRIGTTTQAMISRKAIVECGDFDLNQAARQDYEMWLRISKKFRCVGVNDFLFTHYIHSGEQISKDINKAISGYCNIYKKYYDDYKKYPLAREHYYYIQLKNYWKAKKIGYVLLFGLKLVLYSPMLLIKR